MLILSMVPGSWNGPNCRFITKGNGRGVKIQESAALNHKQRKHSTTGRRFMTPILAAVVALFPFYNTPIPESFAQTADIQRGAVLFRRACIGCHDAGGNIIQPGSTLFSSDLKRNGLDTEEGIYQITYYGQGRMPGFGENCSPRGQCTFGPRLKEEEIRLLAEFVKYQADQGWQNIEATQD